MRKAEGMSQDGMMRRSGRGGGTRGRLRRDGETASGAVIDLTTTILLSRNATEHSLY